MIPGDFELSKPSRRKIVLLIGLGMGGLVAFAVLAVALTFVITAWFGMPVLFGNDDGPAQPIDFPHTTHVEELGLDCIFCHRNVTKGAAATVPAAGLCMTCHVTIGDDLPEVEKLRAMVNEGDSIDWVRVHRVPDHVHFVHEPHIRYFSEKNDVAPSAVCSTCHGSVGEMSRVKQVRSLKMADCVDCHRENDAPTDCSTCHY